MEPKLNMVTFIKKLKVLPTYSTDEDDVEIVHCST